ncbi:hypothetical protein F2P81_017534 [Scophthalmus maximus]|uniref:Uncharacterized protein n=1 Tax=Scophthalmus maximus TaxID=52904 RepID=A0A6A4S943_SCOMX|nr:hypothetical protein F2P81_017534 [Scophthalmus maximus]
MLGRGERSGGRTYRLGRVLFGAEKPQGETTLAFPRSEGFRASAGGRLPCQLVPPLADRRRRSMTHVWIGVVRTLNTEADLGLKKNSR